MIKYILEFDFEGGTFWSGLELCLLKKLKIPKMIKKKWIWSAFCLEMVWFIVFNATFNNISVISWGLVLLVEETELLGEKPPICHKSLTNFII